MGRLGYQSDAQASLAVSFNSLGGYAAALHHSLTEPYPPYEAIGITDGANYRQLATSLLQIENEFYGNDPAETADPPGERPLKALGERGVEYVEGRCVDVNPFFPIGIDEGEIRFMDIFLLHCLLQASPNDTPEEIAAISRNQHLAAERGRDPALRLDRYGQPVAPAEWGALLLRECEPVAAALDAAHGGRSYRTCCPPPRPRSATRRRCRRPGCSGRRSRTTASHFRASRWHTRSVTSARCSTCRCPDAVAARYARMAEESRAAQRAIEAADTVEFEVHRQRYLGQDLLSGPPFPGRPAD